MMNVVDIVVDSGDRIQVSIRRNRSGCADSVPQTPIQTDVRNRALVCETADSFRTTILLLIALKHSLQVTAATSDVDTMRGKALSKILHSVDSFAPTAWTFRGIPDFQGISHRCGTIVDVVDSPRHTTIFACHRRRGRPPETHI